MALKYSFYDRKRLGKAAFFLISLAAIIIFLLLSNNLVKSLANQERDRMKIWADATERLVRQAEGTDIEFLLTIIEQNNSIPVLVADDEGNIQEYRNFKLPDAGDQRVMMVDLSDKDKEYLQRQLYKTTQGKKISEVAKTNDHFIPIKIFDNYYQYIYYEDSEMLKRLSWYPYIQLGVMVFLAVIVFLTILYTKRAEQNRVWVGLSKETAHQLGTPISSLMAWMEFLQSSGVDPDVVREMNKDVKRLSVIADRFSKIGSIPELELEYLGDSVQHSLEYMRSRISKQIDVRMDLAPEDCGVHISRPLFEWVMENLTKNAVDAMEGKGTLTIKTGVEKDRCYIDVTDTGKGIARKNFKNVFNPGYTTKKRGWGLGLTLVKRIIEEYHKGRIFVLRSEPGQGTTFRIILPKV
ncbi:MAG: HAMP domain-containing histidine kinase [Muribaculaceae bacterium]|nr:HAMP domain-containing histidine kinase [Muribaculaceae bacterium]